MKNNVKLNELKITSLTKKANSKCEVKFGHETSYTTARLEVNILTYYNSALRKPEERYARNERRIFNDEKMLCSGAFPLPTKIK